MVLHDRADYLRRLGRRADAPDELKRMIDIIVKAERRHTVARKDLRAFEHDHKATLRRLKSLRDRSRRWMFRVMDLKRQLGLFQSAGILLPHLIVHRY